MESWKQLKTFYHTKGKQDESRYTAFYHPNQPIPPIEEKTMREALISALKRRGFSVRESGKNVGAQMVNICCPFCEEERFHLGVHAENLWFHCFAGMAG